MPVYEYLCGECSHCFEAYREVSQRSACRCPECGARARKVLRPVGIIFKGSGFHCTDYRKPEAKAGVGAEGTKPDPVSTGGDEAAAKSKK